MQVDDSVCVTGGSDGGIRIWDLRRAGDDEDALSLGDAPEIVNHSDALDDPIRSGPISRSDDDRVADEGPCVRVLEGHSKAVSAIYFEDSCLVS